MIFEDLPLSGVIPRWHVSRNMRRPSSFVGYGSALLLSAQILTVSGRVVCDRVIWKLFQNLRTQPFSAAFTVFCEMSRTQIPVPDAVFFEPKYLVHIFIAKLVTALSLRPSDR
jgi:hypothetical protein